jgi:RHS repeat-associated protein
MCDAPEICVLSCYKFTGKERDSETGLDYFGARYYGSNMGRWMSPDWSAAASSIPYADYNDPQSLNLYGYVRNNPLSHADVDGHDWGAAWANFKTFVNQLYVRASVGVGFGGKVKVGTGLKVEAAVKANLEFSGGKLSLTKSVELNASAGVEHSKAQAGVGVSADQTVGSVNVGTHKFSGPEPPEGEVITPVGTERVGVQSSGDRLGIGAEAGDGLLGGGEAGASKEGWKALGNAVNEVGQSLKNALNVPSPPPAPPPPPPPTNQTEHH